MKYKIVFFVSTLISFNMIKVYSHTLPDSNWCIGKKLVFLNHMTLNPEYIQFFLQACLADDSSDKDCGEFDHYNRAMQAAEMACEGANDYTLKGKDLRVVPVVHGPNILFDQDDKNQDGVADHHELYSSEEEGIEFSCAVCLPYSDGGTQ